MKEEENQDVCQKPVYEGLFRSLAPALRNFLLYKFRNVSYAEDVVQDAFYVLWQNCRDVTVALAKAYLFRVAKNQMIKKLEREKVHEKYMGLRTKTEEEAGPDFYMEYHELSNKLKVAIEELPDGQREVFLLHRFEGKSYAEMAEMLDVSVKAIEKRMHKALQKLRLIVKQL